MKFFWVVMIILTILPILIGPAWADNSASQVVGFRFSISHDQAALIKQAAKPGDNPGGTRVSFEQSATGQQFLTVTDI